MPVPPTVLRRVALAGVVLAWGAVGQAQPVEVVGTRALGMAGAFVAVADDPSAVYWNPAGLATGDFFGAAVDVQWLQRPRADGGLGHRAPGSSRSTLVGIATPPLGVAYYRLRELGRDRSRPVDSVSGLLPVARLHTHHLGATVLQTLAPGVTVGATLKYVRGTASACLKAANTTDEIREAARHLPGRADGAFDVDLGVLASFQGLAAGLVVRNVLEPSFDAATGREFRLERHLRAGVSLRPADGWVMAVDADLTPLVTVTGRWRRAAVGVERWWPERWLALRAGLRLNTLGEALPVVAGGVSLRLRPATYLDGQGTLGASEAEQAWGLSLRVAF